LHAEDPALVGITFSSQDWKKPANQPVMPSLAHYSGHGLLKRYSSGIFLKPKTKLLILRASPRKQPEDDQE
jgi:hypothetical protein